MPRARAKVACHSCEAIKVSPHGGDIHCSPECRKQAEAIRVVMADTLDFHGFTPVAAVPNLFVKDGVHISIEEALREGIEKTLARHKEAVAAYS